MIQSDDLTVGCPACGNTYSLHMATVCPECFAWPRRISHYGPPEPKIGGVRVSRKPRLDEMDQERQS